MLKKTITYTTFDGEELTEDFYFHLTKAEVIEMELSGEGNSFSDQLQRIIRTRDGALIMKEFKRIILMSYGEKEPGGKRFIKNQELRDAFSQTEAYSVLFMELATGAGAAAEFIRGVVPQDLADEAAKVAKDVTEIDIPDDQVEPKKFEDYSHADLMELPQEEFQRLVPKNPKDMSRDQLLVSMERKNRAAE